MRFESGGNGSAAKCVPLLYYGQENLDIRNCPPQAKILKSFQATYASGMSFSVKIRVFQRSKSSKFSACGGQQLATLHLRILGRVEIE